MEICVPMAKTCGGMPTLTGITAVLLVRSCSHRCGVLRIVRPSFLIRPDPADLLPHLRVRWLHLSDPIFYITGVFKAGTTGFNLADRIRHITLPALVLAVQEIAICST